jgi:hypothetical protein
MGLEGSAAKKLMEGEWRDGSFAEYAKFPLENVFALDEDVLLNKLGYSIEDLCTLPGMRLPSSPTSSTTREGLLTRLNRVPCAIWGLVRD